MTIENVNDLISRGEIKRIGAAVQEAIDADCDPEVLLKGMLSTMQELGEKLKNGEMDASKMLLAVKAMLTGVTVIKPYLPANTVVALDQWLSGPRWT